MKKWITLFLYSLFATALLTAGGCSKKEESTKPAAKAIQPSGAEEKAEGTKPAEANPATQIVETIKKYWDAFNANDLNTVMTCFSDDSIYQPGDGKTHRGKAEIRAAFEPRFKASMLSISMLRVKSKKSIATRGMDPARTFSPNLGELLG